MRTMLWGLFCACSWTWCIGMFLPKLMIDRFGWPGFIVFAVPNVLGCAAFGYIVRTRHRSDAMIARHGLAMTWFSIITVAYHMFFIVFLLAAFTPVEQTALLGMTSAAVVLGLGMVLSFLPDRDWLWLTGAVYALSIAALVVIGIEPLAVIQWRGEQPPAYLACMTPVIVFGFALCPYLDLTFHRALRNSPSVHAFAVFGFAFTVMIVLTCVIWFGRGMALPAIALAHLFAQIIFTVGAHLREVRLSPAVSDPIHRWCAMILPLAAAPLLFTFGGAGATAEQAGESIYLRFLVFYGLAFPAIVAIAMITPGRGGWTLHIALAVIIIASLPLYELGFLHGRPWLLNLPVAALLGWAATRWIRLRRQPALQPQ